jgi:hypothetical protein
MSAHTLIMNCFSCLYNTLVAIIHIIMFPDTCSYGYFFLFWYVKLEPKIMSTHFSYTLYTHTTMKSIYSDIPFVKSNTFPRYNFYVSYHGSTTEHLKILQNSLGTLAIMYGSHGHENKTQILCYIFQMQSETSFSA